MVKTITFTQDMTGRTLDTYLYPDGDLSGCTLLTVFGDLPHYRNIDERRDVPDDDTTYVYNNTSSVLKDLYTLPNKYDLGTINYIQVYTRAKSADDAQHMDGIYKIILSPDSVCTHVYKSDDIGLVTAYRNYFKVWTENPLTGLAWTWSDINAMSIGVECNSPGATNPEIRTTQCYVKVNSSPTYLITCMNCPEEVSTSHGRNIKMMNMWNGNRVVYDLNRSGKSMILQGKEFEPDYRDVSTTTDSFYFIKFNIPNWQNNPERMVDGILGNYASTSVDEQIQLLTANNATDQYLGKIADVSIRWFGFANFLVGGRHIRCNPKFNGVTLGEDKYDYQHSTTPEWTPWFSITNDVNAPTTWVWNDLVNLDAEIRIVAGANLTMNVSKVEIKVRHYPNTCSLKTATQKIFDLVEMVKRGADITINDFSFCAFNGVYKIRSFGWDIIQEKPIVYKWYLELEQSTL